MPTLASFYGGPSGLISRNTLNVSTGNWSPASSDQPGHTRNSRQLRTANIFSPHKIFLRCNFPARRVRRVDVFGGSRDPVSWVPLVTLSRGAGDAAPRPGDKNPDVTSFIFVSRWRPRPTLRCMPASKGGNEMFTVTFTILRTRAYRCVAFSHLSIYDSTQLSLNLL